MCKELFVEFPIFRNTVAEMDSVLQSLPHSPVWTLREAILEPKGTSNIMDPTQSQPTCTAIQVALVKLLDSWRIAPSAVLGHSSGEIAAAFAAGFISSAQAITIAYYRGYVVGKNILDGAMMAAGLSSDEANKIIAALQLTRQIRVACVNSPESVTVSGDASAIEVLLKHLQAEGKFARKLQTGGRAYHSHHMLTFGDEYQRLLEVTKIGEPSSKMPLGAIWVSSVTGEIISKDSVGPSYWRKNLENPVEFAKAVTRLSQEGTYHLIELGPHSALELPVKQIRTKLNISEETMPYSSAIVRNKDAVECVLNMAGRLYLHGSPISFDRVNESIQEGNRGSKLSYRVLHDLPAYRWTYAESPLWHESRSSSELRTRTHRRHELLGAKIPAGNGLEISWKNLLRVEDVPWLKDHKLEETIVFPGAGYLAMAIEAISQVSGLAKSAKRTIHMRNFNILSALALSGEQNTKVELFTTLRPTPITYASTSAEWWEFTVVSFVDGISTTHATGTVRITTDDLPISTKSQVPSDALEPSAPRVWYEKLAKKGLNFGPQFRTITDFKICRLKTLQNCTATVPLHQDTDDELYPIHPVTIDAMLQAGIVATTAGNTQELRAKVPTRVESATFEINKLDAKLAWSVKSNAIVAGFGSAVINSELVNSDGQVKAQLENVRLAPYEAAGQLETNGNQRHPMLRVLWKPDVSPGLMTAEDLTKYLQSVPAESHASLRGSVQLAACLSLVSHRNPYLRVLQLGDSAPETTKATLDMLLADTAFVRLLSYTTGRIDESGQLFGSKVDIKTGEAKKEDALPLDPDFDLVILSDLATSNLYLEKRLKELKGLLSSGGILLAVSQSAGVIPSQDTGLTAIKSQMESTNGYITLAHRLEDDGVDIAIKDGSIVIVEQVPSALGDAIIQEIKTVTGQRSKRISFEDISTETIPPGTVVFSLLESKSAILPTISDEEMSLIKTLTHNASTLVWVTSGNLLNGQKPDHSLVFGLSRAVMMEQPSLRFFAYDVDNIDINRVRTARNVVSVFKRSPTALPDFEYIERDGIVHVSRFVPDDLLNEAFRQNQGAETVELPLIEAQPAQISIKSPGQFDTLFFKQINLPELGTGQVQIGVKAVGLNAKDFYALGGKIDTRNACCTLEHCGIVEKIGSGVTDLAVGDRVVVMAPGFFKTSEIVPTWACQKLQEEEDFNVMCTLPLVYGTALFALHTKAQIQPGESVLIHSGAGGVGIAAIQLAQLAGAEVFTTVSTDDKKEFLVNTFGVKPENVFTSRDTSFETSLMEATNGRGVDIVLNSLTGDLLHASWRCCGSFGRFIELGKRDLADAGRLAMDQFLKNASFIAFDLSELYSSSNPAHNRIWSSLLAQVLSLYRQKKIVEFPLEVFDIQDLPNAFRRFSSRNRMGKVGFD
jgi:NADPH:quinone reductase-like Zn-dependent oxidoreductase/malonyl CoA-acyl carrier protein transacylase